jgi:hypothetical protein
LFIPNIYASSDPNTEEAKAKKWPLVIRIEYSLHLNIHAKKDRVQRQLNVNRKKKRLNVHASSSAQLLNTLIQMTLRRNSVSSLDPIIDSF